jgi:hypothetical protein
MRPLTLELAQSLKKGQKFRLHFNKEYTIDCEFLGISATKKHIIFDGVYIKVPIVGTFAKAGAILKGAVTSITNTTLIELNDTIDDILLSVYHSGSCDIPRLKELLAEMPND